MIVGGILIATTLITYFIFRKETVTKYSLKYYKMKWGRYL
jgi:hypothetical protein